MSEDYLWDRSGPPDPEIVQLERALAPLRYRPTRPRTKPAAWAAAAAIVAAAVAASQFHMPVASATDWHVGGAAVRAGQTIRTGSRDEKITLESSATGRVELFPNSELRATGGRRLQLNRGALHAFVWAPPREFVIDTPSARAVDLGCEYTLTVDPSGRGLVKVTMGWVAFQFKNRESFIPAGAECTTSPRYGPGIPYYADSPAEFRGLLARYEKDGTGLGALLASARPRDGLTVWHLLTRVAERDRGVVFDRLSQLAALPQDVSRDAVLRREPAAIDQCWNALKLESTSWWRGWERRWN